MAYFNTARKWLYCAVVLTTALAASNAAFAASDPYADPVKPALPASTFRWDASRTALVVIDPQIDFMSPKGAGWPIFGQSVTEQHLVPNLGKLFAAFKQSGTTVAISPHYYYPHDHRWQFEAPVETVQHKLGLFDRKGALTLDGFRNSGADFMPEFKAYIEDGKTIIASPHKLYGPQSNDLMLQLRKQRVDKIVLAGMASNLCVESHLREFIERGFEVVVVRDAVAGPKLPDGDGYGSALTNFRYIANGVMTTDEVVARLHGH
ncbi:cysteine hydrolase [Dyella soli]|uniref:Cysteine hydrolase n=1 Tax=Dyella soli TaxID=522319 RepID=A0A4R0YVB3_9GAMM|nr:cysteine hydrolase [Dyella soli]TCI09126.1 cysteine hydrolase [Dyella soli]